MSRPPPSVPRTDFGPAPPGYVPGLGRGAVGFTTRSDIGPARPMAEQLTGGRGRSLPVPPLPPGYGARGVPTVTGPTGDAAAAAGSSAKASEDEEVAKYSDANFDEFSGYTNELLFATGEYDAEDKEADMIYDAIDRRMDSRRKRRREEVLKAEMAKQARLPQISKQFADLKRELKEMPVEAWESIPEALDYSHHNKIRKTEQERQREKLTAVPDNIIADAVQQLKPSNTVQDEGLETPLPGAASIAGTGTPADLTSIGRARDKMLSMKLDRMADSVSGQTVVDPKGYMTQMQHGKVTSDTEVSDIKKAKLLLRSVIQTNPKHGPGWIAAARLERETGKLSQARQIILKGTEMAPTNEDVWVEAAAMHPPHHARAILAKAVTHLPTSVNIWIMAANLETDAAAQKAVLRRALEHLPTSVRLWKAAVELESPEDARIMLSRAVELVPDSVEMWLALAQLETYEQARVVLNRARKAVPTDSSIWITAAKLEEAHGNVANVDLIIKKAVASLAKFQVVIDRDSWLAAAEEADKNGDKHTCAALVKHTIGLGVEELDRKLTWTNDMTTFEAKGAYGVARAIAAHLCNTFPEKKSVWLKAAQLEKAHATPEEHEALLRRAVTHVPHCDLLWLMLAKHRWSVCNDVAGAREVLQQAFDANKNSEEIWLAAVKLEFESNEYERARKLLAKAREAANTPRVWMKSAKIERMLKDDTRQKQLLEQALTRFPTEPKLHMMLGQLLHRQGSIDQARDVFKRATKSCPDSVDLWLVYAKFELEVGKKQQAANQTKLDIKQEATANGTNGNGTASASVSPAPSASHLLVANPFAKCRALLETARTKLPRQPLLWLAAIRVELEACMVKAAQWLLAKSLQECPTSGLLWSQAIAMDERPQKKSRSYEALERCNEDAFVLLAVAKLFWTDRKISKSRSWFQRAVDANPDLGDAWIYWLKFEMEHGTKEQQQTVIDKCMAADPAHGEAWTAISKDDEYARCKADEIIKIAAQKINPEIFTPFPPIS